jgi:Fic family protein
MGRPSRQDVLQSLEDARSSLRAIGGLPEPMVFQDIWAGIWTEETHHSTALEGNTLRQRQVRMLLEQGIVSGQTTLNEVLEARAYGNAAKWVYDQAYKTSRTVESLSDPVISEMIIREIHKLVVGPVWPEFPPEGLVRGEQPGAYRLKDHDPLRNGLAPLASSLVPSALEDWTTDVNATLNWMAYFDDKEKYLVEDLARLHAAFERIHPFPDGNGRVGRLVLTQLLVRMGHPPAIIEKGERTSYLKALKRADDGDCGPLAELLARSVRKGIYRFLIPNLAGTLSVVPLAGLARDDGLSHAALLAAAQRGRLRAEKVDGTWKSTSQWVDEYKASRYRRRRKSAA